MFITVSPWLRNDRTPATFGALHVLQRLLPAALADSELGAPPLLNIVVRDVAAPAGETPRKARRACIRRYIGSVTRFLALFRVQMTLFDCMEGYGTVNSQNVNSQNLHVFL